MLNHQFVSSVPDEGDTSLIRPSDWNADHAFTGGAIGHLLYRDTGASGGASWLAPGAVGTVLLGGGAGVAPFYGSIDLAVHTSGSLPVNHGGTGLASYAVGDLLYASGATALSALADVAVGNVLLSGGVTTAPAWGKVADAHVAAGAAIAWSKMAAWPTSGQMGYWSRTGTVMSPATAGDSISTSGNLTITGAGPHAIGGATSTGVGLYVKGAFTGVAGSTSYGTLFSQQVTVAAGQIGQAVSLIPTLLEAATGVHALLAGLYVTAPLVTAGAATVTNTASVYITAAPVATVTNGNYALWVKSGVSRFDGTVRLMYDVDSKFRTLATNTTNDLTLYRTELAPVAPTAALAGAGAGAVDNGTHVYAVTFTTATGETVPGASSAAVTVADKTSDGKVAVTIPLGSTSWTTQRNIYRSKAGTTTPLYYIGVVNDNVTTTFTDDVADADISVLPLTFPTTLDSSAVFYGNGNVAFLGSASRYAWGGATNNSYGNYFRNSFSLTTAMYGTLFMQTLTSLGATNAVSVYIQPTFVLGTASTSNNHALLAGLQLTPVAVVKDGADTVTNTAMLYISAAMTPVVTGANYSIWVAAGMSRFSGGAMVALTAYATNQAALDAGLAVGTLYKTAAGVVMVVQ